MDRPTVPYMEPHFPKSMSPPPTVQQLPVSAPLPTQPMEEGSVLPPPHTLQAFPLMSMAHMGPLPVRCDTQVWIVTTPPWQRKLCIHEVFINFLTASIHCYSNEKFYPFQTFVMGRDDMVITFCVSQMQAFLFPTSRVKKSDVNPFFKTSNSCLLVANWVLKPLQYLHLHFGLVWSIIYFKKK